MTKGNVITEITTGDKSVVEQSLDDFQEYLKINNMSANTIHVYLFAARQFLDRYHVISHDNLMLYKCYLMEHYKPQTVNLRIRALNCYMESLKLSSSKMLMIRVQQKTFLENIISQADYEYLKNCLIRDGNMLYYFVVRFMAATGVRVSELVMTKVEHVKCGYMDIYSKDNKIRRIYFPKSLRVEALKWLGQINRVSGYVFLNRYGEPITPAGIRGQLKKFTALYGLDPKVVYPHSFRHRFAKNFIEKCGDISMLSDILGHESIETTRIYLHRSSTEQKQIVNQIVNW
ncbi:tyrosine-type recombinase/integrase [Lacrimispora sp. 38-1]|uniref:tyrosine-type recombinase/integrase n=1 Tax=Lacrimispora sp. 38-1 TaxID=3125778 RepID=UPI003CF2ECC1